MGATIRLQSDADDEEELKADTGGGGGVNWNENICRGSSTWSWRDWQDREQPKTSLKNKRIFKNDELSSTINAKLEKHYRQIK